MIDWLIDWLTEVFVDWVNENRVQLASSYQKTVVTTLDCIARERPSTSRWRLGIPGLSPWYARSDKSIDARSDGRRRGGRQAFGRCVTLYGGITCARAVTRRPRLPRHRRPFNQIRAPLATARDRLRHLWTSQRHLRTASWHYRTSPDWRPALLRRFTTVSCVHQKSCKEQKMNAQYNATRMHNFTTCKLNWCIIELEIMFKDNPTAGKKEFLPKSKTFSKGYIN